MPGEIAISSVLPSGVYYNSFKDSPSVKLQMWIEICKTSTSEVEEHSALQPTWHSEEKAG